MPEVTCRCVCVGGGDDGGKRGEEREGEGRRMHLSYIIKLTSMCASVSIPIRWLCMIQALLTFTSIYTYMHPLSHALHV